MGRVYTDLEPIQIARKMYSVENEATRVEIVNDNNQVKVIEVIKPIVIEKIEEKVPSYIWSIIGSQTIGLLILTVLLFK